MTTVIFSFLKRERDHTVNMFYYSFQGVTAPRLEGSKASWSFTVPDRLFAFRNGQERSCSTCLKHLQNRFHVTFTFTLQKRKNRNLNVNEPWIFSTILPFSVHLSWAFHERFNRHLSVFDRSWPFHNQKSSETAMKRSETARNVGSSGRLRNSQERQGTLDGQGRWAV